MRLTQTVLIFFFCMQISEELTGTADNAAAAAAWTSFIYASYCDQRLGRVDHRLDTALKAAQKAAIEKADGEFTNPDLLPVMVDSKTDAHNNGSKLAKQANREGLLHAHFDVISKAAKEAARATIFTLGGTETEAGEAEEKAAQMTQDLKDRHDKWKW